jgi:hypothetical protein
VTVRRIVWHASSSRPEPKLRRGVQFSHLSLQVRRSGVGAMYFLIKGEGIRVGSLVLAVMNDFTAGLWWCTPWAL